MKNYLWLFIFSTITLPATAATDLQCGGTEPFWGAKINDTKIVYSAPDVPGLNFTVTQQSFPEGVPDNLGFMMKATGPAGSLVVTVRADATCSDGMSETEYSHQIWFLHGKKLLLGCCNKRIAPPRPL